MSMQTEEFKAKAPRTPYKLGDTKIGRTKVDRDAPSMTQQHFKEKCDINNIMAKYQKTGVVDHVAKFQPEYGFIDGATFTENMMQIAKAQNMFNELPSRAREYFGNDPAKFLDFVDEMDDSHLETMMEIGLSEVPVEQLEPVTAVSSQTNSQALAEAAEPPPADDCD